MFSFDRSTSAGSLASSFSLAFSLAFFSCAFFSFFFLFLSAEEALEPSAFGDYDFFLPVGVDDDLAIVMVLLLDSYLMVCNSYVFLEPFYSLTFLMLGGGDWLMAESDCCDGFSLVSLAD